MQGIYGDNGGRQDKEERNESDLREELRMLGIQQLASDGAAGSDTSYWRRPAGCSLGEAQGAAIHESSRLDIRERAESMRSNGRRLGAKEVEHE